MITMSNATLELPVSHFFGNDRVDLDGLRARLDALPAPERLALVRRLGRREQARLFEAAQGFHPITLADLVPAEVPPLTEVVHEGRNTLPAFNFFQKRFCAPSDPALRDRLWGYNHQSWGFLTGPGYFIARPHGADGVGIDYYRVPPEKPAAWPRLRDNESGLGRLVYGHMVDHLRGLSRHVTIGRASKDGKEMDAWFLLCRTR